MIQDEESNDQQNYHNSFWILINEIIWFSWLLIKWPLNSAGRNRPVSMMKPAPDGDSEGLNEQFDDVMANITTEHHF